MHYKVTCKINMKLTINANCALKNTPHFGEFFFFHYLKAKREGTLDKTASRHAGSAS